MLEGQMGKGYATEAAGELLRRARGEFGFPDITAFPSVENPASNRVAQKLGFVEGGRIPDGDRPGKVYAVWILPGMKKIEVSGAFRLSDNSQMWSATEQEVR